MAKEMPKAYEPGQYEDNIYKEWENSGFFDPDKLNLPKNAPAYSIVMPPPNVTGTLHMGHAAMLAIEDILIRYYRMRDYRALWVPGTDHAAIATQTKVEKILKEEGTDRHKLGRKKFLERVEAFAQESHDTIVHQVKRMGSSCDWSREAYTLDETRTHAVRSVFKLMYEDGLIYRGLRIVNWCPRCHSTLADDEVEYIERKDKLYWLKYGPFTLATTRPETKLGDTAVAVYPGDKRYRHMVGKKYMIPGVLGEFEITVVADNAVDPKFGSGAIKVTPAHDFTDYEIAQRNKIAMKQIINEEGQMMENCGKYAGLTTTEAREAIVADMEAMGLIDHIDGNYSHNIAVCYRCGTQIEPLPSRQWFIDVNKKINQKSKIKNQKSIDWEGKSIKEIALEVVKLGKIKIVPERFEKNYYHWMENLRDWCISRQIWYGHQVPVWYKKNVKIKNQKSWDLKIYGEDIFSSLKIGKKTIELRAGRERGEGKYWGDFKEGDIIEFRLADAQTDKIIDTAGTVKKSVKKVKDFRNLEEVFKIYDPSADYPGKSKKELTAWWMKNPQFKERIKKYGIWVIELDEIKNEEIYIGIEAPKGEGPSFAPTYAKATAGKQVTAGEWRQDEDTLDTWFSSGLWTFSTLAHKPSDIIIKNGKLEITSDDFKRFHPTAVLETGYDILFFWIARMIIMTTYAVEEVPFNDVYLHGLVRDEKGRKMSKSLGNTIDPLDMCLKYGTDATRLSLVIGTSPGNDMNLSEVKISGYKNFVNKLWNVARYILQSVKETKFPIGNLVSKKVSKEMTLADRWITGKIDSLIKEVTDDLNNYRFSQAGERLRAFTWDDLADWYLEASKFEPSETKGAILMAILTDLLKLWHPFIPFVTEAIWQEMGKEKLLMVEKWPAYAEASAGKPASVNASAGKPKNKRSLASTGEVKLLADFELIKNVIIAIRNARSENKVEPARRIKAVVYAGKNTRLLKSQSELIMNLRTGIGELEIGEKGKKIDQAIYATAGGIEIYLLGAVDAEKEKERIKKETANLEKIIAGAEKKLANKEFTDKAPAAIVEKEKEKLGNWQSELKKLREQSEKLGN